jgi:16S rRNA (guanine1516-N2)-methyltransferase
MRALVTTAPSGNYEEADELARRFGLTAEPRADRLVPALLDAAQGAPVLVLGSPRADLFDGGRAFRASIGMGYLRFVRTRGGQVDPLVTAAKLRPGDRVLDATLGLAQDALVAAEVTGEPVEGLEASPVLAAFVVAALRRLPGTAAREAAARIHVRCADHRAALKELPTRSFDVVLLDPMFRTAADASPLFDLLRRHGEHAPLDAQTLKAAQRVARRGVLVKDAAPGTELTRLDLVPLPSRRTARIVFGWAPAE